MQQVHAGVRRLQHVLYSLFGARAKQTESDLYSGIYNTYFKYLCSKNILKYCVLLKLISHINLLTRNFKVLTI